MAELFFIELFAIPFELDRLGSCGEPIVPPDPSPEVR